MITIMLLFSIPLSILASYVLSPLDFSSEFKLFVVMVLTPLIMNSVQFWITDNVIRKRSHNANSNNSEQKALLNSRGVGDVEMTTAVTADTTEDGSSSSPISEARINEMAIAFNATPMFSFLIDEKLNDDLTQRVLRHNSPFTLLLPQSITTAVLRQKSIPIPASEDTQRQQLQHHPGTTSLIGNYRDEDISLVLADILPDGGTDSPQARNHNNHGVVRIRTHSRD